MSVLDNLWGLLPLPALVIAADDGVKAANGAAEAFLGSGEAQLKRRSVVMLFGENSRIAELVRIARRETATAADHNVEFLWPGRPAENVDLIAASDEQGDVLLLVQPRSMAEHIDRSLTSRNAARSMTGMAAMLAHEIKNPLAGISGAAQLLEMSASEDDVALTTLIRDETKRIETLINRVEAFGGDGPIVRKPVNVHDVLDKAKRAAVAGFGRHLRFYETYDPSLPEVPGDEDQLMQVAQNLLKNAAEAAPKVGGVVSLRTSYRPGVSMPGPDGARIGLPFVIEVNDNGPGVPEELQPDIFEPFVTSKASGSGLGLSLASKIIADHGGTIDCLSRPGWTSFRIRLPIWRGG